MIDLSAAKSQSTLLMMGSAITNLPMIANKSSINTQIEGIYSMIFPLMHRDFPLSIETEQAITLAHKQHNMTNAHNGSGSTNVPSMVQGNIPFISKEIVSPEKITVKADSKANSIGYGV